jgi:hypothetical protein
VTDPAGRRRLDRTGRRLVVAETAGFALIVFAVSQAYADPWRAIAATGAGIIWICQIIEHRTRPG